MKKVFLFAALAGMFAVSCGSAEETKVEEVEQEMNEKFDEAVNEMEETMEEAGDAVDSTMNEVEAKAEEMTEDHGDHSH